MSPATYTERVASVACAGFDKPVQGGIHPLVLQHLEAARSVRVELADLGLKCLSAMSWASHQASPSTPTSLGPCTPAGRRPRAPRLAPRRCPPVGLRLGEQQPSISGHAFASWTTLRRSSPRVCQLCRCRQQSGLQRRASSTGPRRARWHPRPCHPASHSRWRTRCNSSCRR